ncbi:MAG: hypothetical protein ACP5HM_06205 [Anaerolineae bacterium]
MAIEFLSIVIFTFALGLVMLGAVTWWMERAPRRNFGLAMIVSGLLIAVGYAFLGSRLSIALFGRLIVTIDLPQLMMTAMLYTTGVLTGLGIAGALFLWISRRFVQPTRLARQLALFLILVLLVALLVSYLAVQLSGGQI